MLSKTAILLVGFFCFSYGIENKARYDNYRVYRVHLKTEDQVKVFQEIEARSDSHIFMGHARTPNQNLSILTAAHKISELTDLMKANQIEHTILVSLCFFRHYDLLPLALNSKERKKKWENCRMHVNLVFVGLQFSSQNR